MLGTEKNGGEGVLGAEKNVVEECWLLRKMGGGGGREC